MQDNQFLLDSYFYLKAIKHKTLQNIVLAKNIREINTLKMDKSSLQQTLRRSRQVQEKYKKYMQQKQQNQKRWAETQAKIDATINKLNQTKQVIKEIDNLYTNYQKSLENAVKSAIEGIQFSKVLQVADIDFKPNIGTPKQIANLIKKKKKVVFMTGAGISAASGIPTFRDKDGYWTKKKLQGITPQQYLTLSNYRENPKQIWGWLEDFYCTKQKCKPNIGHVAIDQLCNKIINNKGQACIVTQNIDNFHCQSLSKLKYPIYEVHGNILKIRCDKCAKDKEQMVSFDYKKFRNEISSGKIALCPSCSQSLRPHIMFFDEFYVQKYHHSQSVKNFISKADLLIVIGTALQTGLARNTVQTCIVNKIDIIQINPECTIRQKNVIWLQGKSQEILKKIRQY